MDTKKKILEEIKNASNKEFAEHHQRFFKTGKGEYGEGDLFYGIKVPVIRAIAKTHWEQISLGEIEELLQDPYHEVRLAALFLMIFKYEKRAGGNGTGKKDFNETKSEILNLYLSNTNFINNWDLVDLSAPKIVGNYAFENKKSDIIYALADENHLWSNRIAVVASHYYIKKRDFSIILALSERFLLHEHDLMRKAVGWMLREMGKIDIDPLYCFLDKYHKTMPRTMLRYSIERLHADKRLHYMS
jgi:3-methyladenine DNA glycosylase AlkD